ncbi:ABC transporter ATP-binding protein [Corynebacterium atypicum]|uniref:ABC transporter ATP-binding protein n=1 Tax=Corynebacterium atypicum TaxID=191610 RepID=UPI000A063ED4|nr:ABC transporter ATP-binding protein [Corynebacterium atypicum]
MIEVAHLTKRFGSTTAVEDLSFTVKPGVVTGFLGPNGAGKTTTMRMILGLDKPNEGRATINGVPYQKLRHPLHSVGALLEARAVHPNRSARNHLRWIATSNGIAAHRVDEVLELVGLADVAKRHAGGFSLGMSQRLGLAAALLGDPEVLLLDEPVNGLDPEGIRWVRGLIQALAAEGRTVLVSSHLLAEMAVTAERLVVIGRGRLIADTSTHAFIREHSALSTVVRSPQLEVVAAELNRHQLKVERTEDADGRPCVVVADCAPDEIGEIAFAASLPLAELSERRASLEEAFLKTTGHAVEYHAGKSSAGAAREAVSAAGSAQFNSQEGQR